MNGTLSPTFESRFVPLCPELVQLSQRRSDAVRDHYIEVGLDPSRLVAIGRGEAEPLASNDTAEGRRRNRRIDFIANPSDDLFEQE